MIPFVGIYLKKPKTLIQKDIQVHPYVHCSIIFNSQAMETTQEPISRQMYKKVVTPWNDLEAIM